MNKSRLEAFSDGVLAIIITIMVLELKIPEGDSFEALRPLFPKFFSYILSFIYVGIYWNNHHHMMHTVRKVTGSILLSNLHLLFWLSLIPFVTAWIGEKPFAPFPMFLYGIVLLMCAIAYFILQNVIIKNHGATSILAKAVGQDYKGKASLFFYMIAPVAAFYQVYIAAFIYVFVAVIWMLPDKRIETLFKEEQKEEPNL